MSLLNSLPCCTHAAVSPQSCLRDTNATSWSPQMNAFCNADDISWGTKNLDTKRADHDAAKMRSKALAYKGALGGRAVG